MNDDEAFAFQLETIRQRLAERDQGGSSPRRSRPERAGRIVSELLERRGISPRLRRMGAVDLWADVVGETIAEATRALRVQDRTLVVEARSSGWVTELNLMRREILSRLNERLEGAEIDRLMFVLAESGQGPREGIRRGPNG